MGLRHRRRRYQGLLERRADNVGAILDLGGATAQRANSPLLGLVLSIASGAAAAAALIIMSALPHEAPSRALDSGPFILEQAFARQTPQRLGLVLPAEIAVPLSQIGTQDGTGNARSAITPRSFRVRATNDADPLR